MSQAFSCHHRSVAKNLAIVEEVHFYKYNLYFPPNKLKCKERERERERETCDDGNVFWTSREHRAGLIVGNKAESTEKRARLDRNNFLPQRKSKGARLDRNRRMREARRVTLVLRSRIHSWRARRMRARGTGSAVERNETEEEREGRRKPRFKRRGLTICLTLTLVTKNIHQK